MDKLVEGSQSIETGTVLPQNLVEAIKKADPSEIRQILNNSRRIITGTEATHNRPYMVYLKLPSNSAKFQDYRRWLCGGVIVHEEYILTSAACIEDVRHFYVVSGTYKFSFEFDRYNNPCIKNGAKKAVWKCIPRNYVFDGHENDNIRWMNNDIAVVKLEDEFDFTRRVRGCDYAPRPICYNNQSAKFEEANALASIAGWGSTDKYNDWVNSRKNLDLTNLLEAPVTIMGKIPCKKRWGQRYHNIIDNYMVCTNDMASELSEICQEKYVDCSDILEDSDEAGRRSWSVDIPDNARVHSANHNNSFFRRQGDKIKNGGFCENDHGGPLVHGQGTSSMVIGIISACLVKEKTNKCYGPFLYTSVYKNRMLINCAIYKNVATDCNKLFRSSDTYTEVEMNWSDHPDGPAKSEISAMRRKQEEEKRLLASGGEIHNATKTNATELTSTTDRDSKTATVKVDSKEDHPMQRVGLILRSRDDDEDIKVPVKPKVSKSTVKISDSNITAEDLPMQRVGLILRSRNDDEDIEKPIKSTLSKSITPNISDSNTSGKDFPMQKVGLFVRSRNAEDIELIPTKPIINNVQNYTREINNNKSTHARK
ncbi:uncharacterized protein LOC126376950 [Pectinophora gossypiella]|uniref:uncharacterized protein LOC126376950 n=1 Tax=Pectinophora gossypiella TaxID=13191 RepID=UPI00214E958A|nr:uncharacterized protein LOC126376950 [Pectinophora gossypiella]